MTDYKNTLNLPQTDFPMKASLATREPQMIAEWEKNQLYKTIREHCQGRPKFVLHMGPPYANGHIHLGTATTTLLKDFIVKSKLLSGYDAPLVPGWDCHGLPIELNVEKKLGKPGQKVSAKEFRQACREYARSFIDFQRDEFKRLGIIADWENPYLTMDSHYEADIIRSLNKMITRGHLIKGYKPVHWCLDCASALAEAEVEYADKDSDSIDVRFPVVDSAAVFSVFNAKPENMPIAVAIWTTTPWSLPGNEAVAVNPALNYALVNCGAEFLIIAEDLLTSTMQRYQIEKFAVLGIARGEALLNLKLHHPFYTDKLVPIIGGEHVTVESGTGAVHTAPAHGLDDYVVGKLYNLPLINPVGNDGCYTSTTALLAGVHVNKANAKIIELLTAQKALIKHEKIRHSYPHCWRHKTPLIFRATPQWFISMDEHHLRDNAEKAIDRVSWIPDWGKARIAGMVANRPDWCISRQRTWGVPIAIFIHKETGELHPKTEQLMESVAKLVEKSGIDAWYELDAKTLLGNEAPQYIKVTDVLDVWFDSGVSHECVLKKRPELHFPADIILEGSDQHRGWFQSSLLSSIAINNKESYKEVLTHGFVVDGQGRKMSKSIGNVIVPNDITQSLGADVLRLWVASVDYRTEIAASKEIFTRISETYRRIRNTARFMLANLHGFDPENDMVPNNEMLKLDQWAVDRALKIQNEIVDAYANYQFHTAVQKLHQFCLSDLGGFYLDIIKDRQYTMAKDSRGRRSAQTALYHLINALARWLAPLLSFTAEEIWQAIPGKKAASVFLSTWYQHLTPINAEEEMNDAFWEKIRAVREAVNKEIENKRNAGLVGSALEAEVQLYCGADLMPLLLALREELRFILITSCANVVAEHNAPLERVITDVPGLSLNVNATTNEKCERCWHRVKSVNQDANYPGICHRCIENIAGQGEIRQFA